MAVYADQELEVNFSSWDYDRAGDRTVVGGIMLYVAVVNLHIFPKTS
jgi:hypothetical protein